MIPGEIIAKDGEIELNIDRPTLKLTVANTGDRPIQIGSHYHFYEVNAALAFDRAPTRGMRLDIPAGTAVRFEPGDEKQVQLVALAGSREIYGFNAQIEGKLWAIFSPNIDRNYHTANFEFLVYSQTQLINIPTDNQGT